MAFMVILSLSPGIEMARVTAWWIIARMQYAWLAIRQLAFCQPVGNAVRQLHAMPFPSFRSITIPVDRSLPRPTFIFCTPLNSIPKTFFWGFAWQVKDIIERLAFLVTPIMIFTKAMSEVFSLTVFYRA
jgi:hypothetical protein